MNSKSTHQTSSNSANNASSSVSAVTGGPLLKERVLDGVDQPILVAERQLEDLRVRQFWPDRLGKAANGRRENAIALVFLVCVQPNPTLDAVAQTDFLGARVLVLLTVSIGAAHRHDAYQSLRRHRQIKDVIGNGDADAGERLDH